jgi:hypothetical protein
LGDGVLLDLQAVQVTLQVFDLLGQLGLAHGGSPIRFLAAPI